MLYFGGLILSQLCTVWWVERPQLGRQIGVKHRVRSMGKETVEWVCWHGD